MSMQDLIEQGIECGADAHEIANVLFSNGFGNTEVLQHRVVELEHSLALQCKAGQRAIRMWQAETGKDLVWPDKADLCVWLMQKNEQLQATNQQLLEALELNDAMLRKGIFNCTDEEMQRAKDARIEAITNAKQQENANVTHSK